MQDKGVPFVALRPGAFLNQSTDYLGDGIRKGHPYAISPWNKTVREYLFFVLFVFAGPCIIIEREKAFCDLHTWDWHISILSFPTKKNAAIGMIHTADLARYFADAIELPDDANGQRIDVGMSRPVAYREVVQICNAKSGQNMGCLAVPRLVRSALAWIFSYLHPLTAELLHMFNFFDDGLYVNDTALQTKYFGPPPTPEEVIGKYVAALLKEKEEAAAAAETGGNTAT